MAGGMVSFLHDTVSSGRSTFANAARVPNNYVSRIPAATVLEKATCVQVLASPAQLQNRSHRCNSLACLHSTNNI
eukprot:23124-Amphidinium_carterae.1